MSEIWWESVKSPLMLMYVSGKSDWRRNWAEEDVDALIQKGPQNLSLTCTLKFVTHYRSVNCVHFRNSYIKQHIFHNKVMWIKLCECDISLMLSSEHRWVMGKQTKHLWVSTVDWGSILHTPSQPLCPASTGRTLMHWLRPGRAGSPDFHRLVTESLTLL